MYIYKFKVKHFDSDWDEDVITSYGIVYGENYSNAIEQIKESFTPNTEIEQIEIEHTSDVMDNTCTFLEKEDWEKFEGF